MTVKIDIQSNIKQVKKKLNIFQKKHLPQASADAINEVGVKAVNAMRSQLAKKLDRPTPFTVKGVELKFKAKPSDLSALVMIPTSGNKSRKYLEKQFEGGTQNAKDQMIPVPYDKGVLNQYGNIRGRSRGLGRRKTEFIGQVKGIDGVWRRTGGKRNPQLKLIIGFEKVVRYTKRLEFYKTISGVVNKNIDKILNKHIQRIIGR